jgi:hypothetical protein
MHKILHWQFTKNEQTIFFILGPCDQCFDFDGICVFIVVFYCKGIRKKLVASFFIVPTMFLRGVIQWKMWHSIAGQYGASYEHSFVTWACLLCFP